MVFFLSSRRVIVVMIGGVRVLLFVFVGVWFVCGWKIILEEERE